jgi:hypothetical protein
MICPYPPCDEFINNHEGRPEIDDTIVLDIFRYTIRHGMIPYNMDKIRQGLNDYLIPEKEE